MNKKLYKLMNWPKIEAIVYNDETHPLDILGSKVVGSNTLFQAYFPNATSATLKYKNEEVKMEQADELGFYSALVADKSISDYSYEFEVDGSKITLKDAYKYNNYFIPNNELAKFSAGINYYIYDFLGSHIITVNNTKGVRFALWAPDAVSVSVIGDFNNNTPFAHIMQKNDEYGVFELFLPDLKAGTKYKYAIKTKNGETLLKADPYCQAIESNDGYSIVSSSEYKFNDSKYNKDISKNGLSILEINLASYKEKGDKLIDAVLKNVQDFGFNCIELMPVMEHLSDDKAYETSAFYAVSSFLGGNDFLKKLIDTLHQNNIGVILDWAPFHFPKTTFGLSVFDGTCLYEHLDMNKGTHPFYGTAMFNYGRNEVSIYLIANALYYLREFHADGLKIDSLSSILYLDYGRNDGEWTANIYGGNENLEAIEFIKHLNSIVKKESDDYIMIAQDDSGYPNMTVALDEGGLGFTHKNNFNMVSDYIDYIKKAPEYRSNYHDELTLSYLYQYKENFINALSSSFVLNKDVLGSISNEDNRLSDVKLSITYMMVHPGDKLIYNDYITAIHNKGLNSLIKDLNKIYKDCTSITELDNTPDGFEWINSLDRTNKTLTFIRKGIKPNDCLYVACNFSENEQKISVGTNQPGKYKEILNTDAKEYGGTGKVNKRSIPVKEIGADTREFSFDIVIAPSSLCIFKYVPFTAKEQFEIDKKKEAAVAKTKALEYKELAKQKEEEVKKALDELNEAKKRMQDAQKEADNFYKLEKEELEKAEKALAECK